MKRLFFFILFLSLLASFGNQGGVKWYRLRQFEKSLEQEIDLLSQGNLTLQKEIADLKEEPFLEYYIREEMGYIRDDEILYEIIDDSTTQAPH